MLTANILKFSLLWVPVIVIFFLISTILYKNDPLIRVLSILATITTILVGGIQLLLWIKGYDFDQLMLLIGKLKL